MNRLMMNAVQLVIDYKRQ